MRPRVANVFYINTLLRSTKRKGNEAYSDLINKTYKKKIRVQLNKDRMSIIRLLYPIDVGEEKWYYGKLNKFTSLTTDEWIDISTLDKGKLEIPKNKFPNSVDTDFVFNPYKHKIALVKEKNGVSIKEAASFFEVAFSKICDPGEMVQAKIINDYDTFESFLMASEVRRLRVEVTYGNDDFSKRAYHLEDRLKNGHVVSYRSEYIAIAENPLNIKEPLIKESLELAEAHGSAEGVVLREGIKKKVSTSEYPKIDKEKYDPEKVDKESILITLLNKLKR